jgi:hypothetical protein
MKRVLSFLLMIVFMHAQVSTAFAKHGGPDLGGQATVDTIGSYAGTMIPVFSTNPANNNSSASIGLFAIGVPQIGVAEGACVIFIDGSAYEGTITAIADPLGGELKGLIDAISVFVLIDPLNPTIQYRVFASGNIDARIRDTAGLSPVGFQNAQTFSTTRIEGEAKVDISASVDANGASVVSNTVTFIVDGFKQSSTVQTASSIGAGVGGGTTP